MFSASHSAAVPCHLLEDGAIRAKRLVIEATQRGGTMRVRSALVFELTLPAR